MGFIRHVVRDTTLSGTEFVIKGPIILGGMQI